MNRSVQLIEYISYIICKKVLILAQCDLGRVTDAYIMGYSVQRIR
jgi:hypothetical protein